MLLDFQLSRELIGEELPAAERQAKSLGLTLSRGDGAHVLDFYIPYVAPDGNHYLVRLRCDEYDDLAPSFQFVNPANRDETGPQWWPRMAGVSYARGDHGEIVYCTPGLREYHQHSSHRNEVHPKTIWKLGRVISVVWIYLCRSGAYLGRGGV